MMLFKTYSIRALTYLRSHRFTMRLPYTPYKHEKKKTHVLVSYNALG